MAESTPPRRCRPIFSRSPDDPVPPLRRMPSWGPAAKRPRTHSDTQPTTPESPAQDLEVSLVPDTPRHSSSSSRPNIHPAQPQNSSRSQRMAQVIPYEQAEEIRERAKSLGGDAMDRKEMEAALREEINGAVYQYAPFCEEFFTPHKGPSWDNVISLLGQDKLFAHNGQQWTVDCSTLETAEDRSTHLTVAKILDHICSVVFTPDQFRPVRRDIIPFTLRLNGDNPNDTNTQPDVVQMGNSLEAGYHWAEVEFFAECKGSSDQLGEALMQLARYARATFVHQIHRLHIFAIAVCGTQATFVRLGSTGILHSPPFDLLKDFRQFALAAAGLFALDPHAFGFNTRFYFWPPLTGKSDDHLVPRETRVVIRGTRWKVLEVFCQRECLVGRATLVLLLCRVKDQKQRVVLKLIWRDQSRPDEGKSLEDFKGRPGICRKIWSEICEHTRVQNPAERVPSPHARDFFPPLPEATVENIRSSGSGTSSQQSRSLAAKVGQLRRVRCRPTPPDERELSLVVMEEGVALRKIKCLRHLLRVLRDGLVGLAAISAEGKVHRDISEGNILWTPAARNRSEDAGQLVESEMVAMGEDKDEEEDRGSTATENNAERSALLGDDPPQPEGGVLIAPTYDAYVTSRYGSLQDVGKLYDFEFMVKVRRSSARGADRTGTPAFISGQLLIADRSPVHSFLHDLESFFWVLLWMLATYAAPGAQRSGSAQLFIGELCNRNAQQLGNYKCRLIGIPPDACRVASNLTNGWQTVAPLVFKFAHILRRRIYDPMPAPLDPSNVTSETPDEASTPDGSGSWDVIKEVIDIFDQQIADLSP